METRILPAPAVAGILANDYIEARLHTDAYDPEREAENQALQLELEGSVGLPFYLVMDPSTEEVLDTFNESARAIVDPGVLARFFEGAREN
ncbi:MAG TPA: hypothetical protein ENJ09_13390 [Planctomycetes bacterium]|nr:hypothetical protein [Planctomycetota bacterium]